MPLVPNALTMALLTTDMHKFTDRRQWQPVDCTLILVNTVNMFVVTSVLVFILAVVILHWLYLFKWKYRSLNVVLGPTPLPIIGNALEFGLNPVDILKDLTRLMNKHGNVFRLNIGPNNFSLIIAEPEITEFFLSSPKYLRKLEDYKLLQPWIGNGLLVSTGSYWQKRRKIITPAFHFKILEESIPIFTSQGDILVEKLSKEVGKEKCDIYPYITLCTLDIICETAMGTTVNAQTYADNEYVKAVQTFCVVYIERVFSVWKQINAFFKFSSNYKVYLESIKTMHKFTNSVIQQRRKALLKNAKENFSGTKVDDDDVGMKKRFVFLDLLLNSTVDNKPLTDEDIREEVDTFMFAGHDTTASAICFALYELSRNPIIQKKAVEELYDIFGKEKCRRPTIQDLNDMKYIELIIKETLRMYPSVPFFGRILEEDATFNGVLYPKGVSLVFFVQYMHRRSDLFEDPEIFDPERYLSKNMKLKNSYAYVPFSAGPRNCIGQKFAMYEMKTILSKVLRNFELLPHDTDVLLSSEIVLKSATGVCLQLKYRKF